MVLIDNCKRAYENLKRKVMNPVILELGKIVISFAINDTLITFSQESHEPYHFTVRRNTDNDTLIPFSFESRGKS